MKAQIIKLIKGMDRILFILESDDKTKEVGLVEKVNNLDETLQGMVITNKSRVIAYRVFAGLAMIIIGWLLKIVFTT